MAEYYNNEVYKKDVAIALSAVVNAYKLTGKRVLVTGASGLIGSFIVDVLIGAGSKVYVAGRNTELLTDRFPDASAVYYDLAKEIDFNENFDFIIHAAGYGHPAAFREDPSGVLLNGINGTASILNYALYHNVDRFMLISSGEVYGNVDSMTSRACYPLGKHVAENLCASFCEKNNLDVVVARLCHTFGPGISKADNRAASQFIRYALNGNDIVLNSKGEQRRSYLYVADAASAILSVLTTGDCGRAYDIASKECVITIVELAELIANEVGKKVMFNIPSTFDKQMQSPIKEQILDSENLTRLGWQSKYTLGEGVTHTLEALR